MRFFILSFCLLCACNLTPVDNSLHERHEQTKSEVAHIRSFIQEGDIVFRLSHTQLAGGLIDFSQEVAKATESKFSHAVLVYEVRDDGVILADVTADGVARRFLIDWHLEGCDNLAIKRLKPEYEFLIPMVLAEAKKLIDKDCLYDDKFIPGDNLIYCTEFVDECFRNIGYPLADRIVINSWPKYNLLIMFGCAAGGIDTNNESVISGNDKIGLFSSPMLYTIYER